MTERVVAQQNRPLRKLLPAAGNPDVLGPKKLTYPAKPAHTTAACDNCRKHKTKVRDVILCICSSSSSYPFSTHAPNSFLCFLNTLCLAYLFQRYRFSLALSVSSPALFSSMTRMPRQTLPREHATYLHDPCLSAQEKDRHVDDARSVVFRVTTRPDPARPSRRLCGAGTGNCVTARASTRRWWRYCAASPSRMRRVSFGAYAPARGSELS